MILTKREEVCRIKTGCRREERNLHIDGLILVVYWITRREQIIICRVCACVRRSSRPKRFIPNGYARHLVSYPVLRAHMGRFFPIAGVVFRPYPSSRGLAFLQVLAYDRIVAESAGEGASPPRRRQSVGGEYHEETAIHRDSEL